MFFAIILSTFFFLWQHQETLLLNFSFNHVDCFLTSNNLSHTFLLSSVFCCINKTDSNVFPNVHAHFQIVYFCFLFMSIISVISTVVFCIYPLVLQLTSRLRDPPKSDNIFVFMMEGSDFGYYFVCTFESVWHLFHHLIYLCL